MSAQIDTLSVTDSNGSIALSPECYIVKIKNAGTSSCYFNLNAAATTSHFKLDPEDEIEIGLNVITSVQAICDSSETTTIQVIGTDAW